MTVLKLQINCHCNSLVFVFIRKDHVLEWRSAWQTWSFWVNYFSKNLHTNSFRTTFLSPIPLKNNTWQVWCHTRVRHFPMKLSHYFSEKDKGTVNVHVFMDGSRSMCWVSPPLHYQVIKWMQMRHHSTRQKAYHAFRSIFSCRHQSGASFSLQRTDVSVQELMQRCPQQ